MRYLFYATVPLWVLLAALLLSCTLGYFIVQGIGDAIPFRQILTRSTQLFLVLSIFPLMSYLRISKEELGFAPRLIFLKQLLQGFGLGFIALMPVFIILYVLKVNVIDEAQSWTIGLLAKNMTINLLVALLISLIEESLFRGIVLVGLSKKLPVIVAILITSIYYAGLHFLSIKTDLPVSDISFFSGFKLLGEAAGNLVNPLNLPAFFALLMVGVFLGVLRTQVNTSLGLCIGCHTCWVWQIKMNKKLFNTDFNAHYHYLVSSYDGVIGPLVTGWLMLAIAGYFACQQMSKAKIKRV
ncbi:MAG: CPBP family intramembrane metalloprotease [Methylococcales bacterium]|nr:CPBP family intramembrane metalloprotease [Methylococcales bacterium]MDD5632728.1 CPBP family intramembrane metalloprotease [Methylococcales bacterium]